MSSAGSKAAPTATKLTPQQANAAFRQAVVNNAVKIVQQLQSISVVPGAQLAYNFTPRNVGLLLGFYVMVSVNMLNTGATSSLTQYGPANLISNFTFSDFNNYQRINAPGWYLSLVNSVKARRPYAAAVTLNNHPINYSNNFTVISAPATLTTTPGTLVQQLYYIPVAYSEYDLRGAIYAAVTGGQMNLQITPNATPWVASGDATLAVYSGGTGGAYYGNMTIDVYQVFYDQLPTINQGGQAKVVVPQIDLGTTYELHQTVANNLAQGQENTIAFSNYREFLSTAAIYDNAGVLNVGSDISYWALQAANLLYIFKKEPFLVAADARREIGTDMPKGTYYFSSREKPINTQTFGNMNLVINPSSVTNSTSQVLVGYETFAQQNVVLGAQAFANAG